MDPNPSIWRPFGRYEVLLLLDGRFETTSDVLVHRHGDAPRRRAIEACGPTFGVDVNCFALRSEDGVMLVDAGTGPFWGPTFGLARTAMNDAGIAPETVERVLLTHIHGDHALGLFDGKDAYFPRAEVIVPEADLVFFTDAAAEAAVPEARRGGFTVAKALIGTYGARLRPIPAGPVLAEITLKALPGHTPGHAGYLIGPETDRLLLWGDTLHLSGAQARDPDLSLVYDIDPALAAETRRTALTEAAAAGWTVGGGHIRGFCGVVPQGDGFRIDLA